MRRLMLFSLAFSAAVAAYLWLLSAQAALFAALGCGLLLLLLLPIRRDEIGRAHV